MNNWQRHNPGQPPPIYWLKVPSQVMEALRPQGFHAGYHRDQGIDANLKQALDWSTNPLRRRHLLREWVLFVDREAALLTPGYTTLWHPHVKAQDEQVLRELFGERLVEIEAGDVDEALHKFRLTRWNLGVFYHVACMNHWKIVVEEQLGLLSRVGLRGVYVSFLGTDEDWEYFLGRAQHHQVEVSLQYRHTAMEMYEIPVMRLVQDWAQHHKEGYLLYFHTKGVSTPENAYRVLWRRVMQACVIAQWRPNAEKLRGGTGIIGVNWRTGQPNGYWPGNFWMARASLIAGLEDFSSFYRKRHRLFPNPRSVARYWVGSGAGDSRQQYSHLSADEEIAQPAYWRTRRTGTDGYLALCLWCKNEGAYLPEWLRYHTGLGVDHFIIFDNNSEHPLENNIKEYIAAGRVTLIPNRDTTQGRQCRAYALCLKAFGPQYTWMGFIDTDEFVVPKTHGSLPELLAPYEGFGGLGIFWYCYGSSGLKTRPPSAVRGFVRRSDDGFDLNDHIKSFVQPRFVSDRVSRDPHHFLFKEGYYCVDEAGQPIDGARRQPRTSAKVQLNHYIVRSEEDCREKMRRGGGNSVSPRGANFFEAHDKQCNRVYDDSAVHILDRIEASRTGKQ